MARAEHTRWRDPEEVPRRRLRTKQKSPRGGCRQEADAKRRKGQNLEPVKKTGAMLLQELRAETQDHARCRREMEQGGGLPTHFVTLTTAVYHWDDLHQVLQKYERFIKSHRGGRLDPPEPGEADLPDAQRLVRRYPGVVTWYCGLKLHLYASCVLAYDDIFGVYEWGSGGEQVLHRLGR